MNYLYRLRLPEGEEPATTQEDLDRMAEILSPNARIEVLGVEEDESYLSLVESNVVCKVEKAIIVMPRVIFVSEIYEEKDPDLRAKYVGDNWPHTEKYPLFAFNMVMDGLRGPLAARSPDRKELQDWQSNVLAKVHKWHMKDRR